MNMYSYKKLTTYKVLTTFFALDLVKKRIGQLEKIIKIYFLNGVFFLAWMGCLTSTSHLPNEDHYHQNDGGVYLFCLFYP